jgi:aryl-alcohol dehydrogenase-like predicted oxidoreductase
MEYRQLGRTGLAVSALGFGCGSVGGLLVRGDHRDAVRAVALAIESGITYFDTARSYGDGKSEETLGLTLEELGADVLVGTKINLLGAEMDDIEQAIIGSVEGSLRRLKRDAVDLLQLHNPVALQRQPRRGWVSVADVETALQTFGKLQSQGKARHCGINGLGDSVAIHQAIEIGLAETVQCCFNLINPTAGIETPPAFPLQDYAQVIDRAAALHMGVIAIRVLAGGALSGTTGRVPNAAPDVAPIGTAATYVEDVALARRFHFLVGQGYVSGLVEAAIRFALSKPEVSTTLVGVSNIEQLEQAVSFANLGPLPEGALSRLPEVWANTAIHL